MTADLRGMDFLVFPYNAVLNVRVLDDAVVADGHVLADVARGIQRDIAHGLVLADNVANVVELRPVLQ